MWLTQGCNVPVPVHALEPAGGPLFMLLAHDSVNENMVTVKHREDATCCLCKTENMLDCGKILQCHNGML